MAGPYLKFAAPLVLTIVGTIVFAAVEGQLDEEQLEAGITGLLAASVSFWVTNGSEGVKRHLKALAPAVLTILATVIHYAVTGDDFDTDELVIAVSGLLAAAAAFLAPNTPDPGTRALSDSGSDVPTSGRVDGTVHPPA